MIIGICMEGVLANVYTFMYSEYTLIRQNIMTTYLVPCRFMFGTPSSCMGLLRSTISKQLRWTVCRETIVPWVAWYLAASWATGSCPFRFSTLETPRRPHSLAKPTYNASASTDSSMVVLSLLIGTNDGSANAQRALHFAEIAVPSRRATSCPSWKSPKSARFPGACAHTQTYYLFCIPGSR